MSKIQKYSQTIALATLMVALKFSPAIADSVDICKKHCKPIFSHSAYVACKKEKGCSEEVGKDKDCKHACARENPNPAYDSCKKECLDKQDNEDSRKRKRD